nr:MAG TPA: hypothetical protein [Inoviridae sp.]
MCVFHKDLELVKIVLAIYIKNCNIDGVFL